MSLSKKLLSRQKDEIECVYADLDCQEIESICDFLLEKKSDSTIYFTGIGKSFNQAKHTSDMLKSLGFRSHILHPIDSLHGDLGALDPGDIVFLYSKSGKTKELMELVFFLKQLSITLIGVFCSEKATLSDYCQRTLILPCGKELDNQFDLVPTTSVISYLIFCNLLVGTIMEKMNINLETYGTNHPSGAIGQKIWLKVEDIMYQPEEICQKDRSSSLLETMIEMSSKRVGYCLIINSSDNNKLEGIVSDGDIRRYLIINQRSNIDIREIKIETLENKNPQTINQKAKITDLVHLINSEKKLSVGLPVVDDNDILVGFIDNKALIKFRHLL